MSYQISLCAAAARPKYWDRFYASLSKNTVSYEVIFVGPNPPMHSMPDNFKYIKSNVKPAQAYEIAIRNATGDLIGPTADDADYNHPQANCPNALDIIWNVYEFSQREFNDKKTILSQRSIEDYGIENQSITWDKHRFFFGDLNSPLMAPLGFMNREFYHQLGGYDKNFICGQHVNDMVMRVTEAGGRVKRVPQSVVYMHHQECHGKHYIFSTGLEHDRQFLERCWVVDKNIVGYKRLRSVEPFSDHNITTINQGPSGMWRD